ncbi:glycosyltransferase [Aggregatilinea lenta]|uniref:glycosyltransferase n=1 Tax=Aggregatilinea lenta TaxID=913108 RepID=UPI000E5BA764|nr:glycosyltransferase [Aggregatilinea lenta]
MDLLLISRCPPFPLHLGDRLIPYHIARELAARGHRIDLLAFYQQPEDLADVPRYRHLFNSVTLLREPHRSLLDYQRRSNPKARFPRRADQSWSPEMWDAIQHALQTRPYDAAHLFGGIHVYEYRELARQLPNVIVPYESYSLWLDRAIAQERRPVPRAVLRLRRIMARRFESWMFDGYDRVVVLTDDDAQALKALNSQTPTVVIPNGVDLDYFSPTGYEPKDSALLFTGNYDYAPNVDAALRLVRDIFPRVKRAVPRARVVIVGGNPPAALKALASEDVEITGRVPDMRPYFEYSQIFVSPLRMGAGIKNKVLEAMAMGKPVVATPLSCDGIPVVQRRHVMLGISNEDLVTAIVELVQTPALRRQIAANGRALIEQRFTWRRVAEQYEALYAQVIAERR